MCFTCGGSSSNQPRSDGAGDKGEEGGDSQRESAFRSWMDTLRDRLGLTKKPNPSPRDDPFYGVDTPSSALDKYAPGAIIRSREVRIADFPDFDAHKVKVWQLAVRSTTPHGKSQVFVTTVIRPPNATGDKIVTQCPKTDSCNPKCRTSYILRQGTPGLTAGYSEQIFMEGFLDRGYIICVPDYEGQRDSFGSGYDAAYCTLDSMRAVLKFSQTLKLAESSAVKIIGWGYSGGAIATGWASQMLDIYAPELSPNVVGWSMGGVPVDLRSVALSVNDTIASGLIIGVVQGLANSYPKLQKWINDNTTDDGKKIFATATGQCFKSFMWENFRKDVLGLIKGSNDGTLFTVKGNPLDDKLLSEMTSRNKMGALCDTDTRAVPRKPMYIYQGIKDYVVPIATVDALVAKWAKKGTTIEYAKDTKALHVGLVFKGHAQNVKWIEDRFEGRPNPADKYSQRKEALVTIDASDIRSDESKEFLGEKRCKTIEKHYDVNYADKPNKPFFYT